MSPRWHDFLADQAARRPDAPALRDSLGAAWTWSGFARAVDSAAQLLQGAGVRPGDRVLLLAENCVTAVAVLFAASQAGAPVIPFNARQTAREVDKIIAHAAPAVIVTTCDVSPDAAVHAERLNGTECTGAYGKLSLAVRHSAPEPLEDVAVILYTTGTTGDPKGVMLTHGNMRFGGMASAHLRDMGVDDLVYGALPISHVFGLASVVTAASYAGAEVWLEPRFTAGRLFDALGAGVTLLPAVPQMHALLMAHVAATGADRLQGGGLRYVSSGGAPLDPAWKRKAEAFYRIALQNGYGMTETTAGICATKHGLGNNDISCGPPLPGVEVRIAGDAESGEIETRGPHVMRGYYRNPQATAEVLGPDGWFRTGDLGRFDAAGHLHILGRSKELIIHGGFNVYPPEIEGVLSDHPDIVQAAVVGHMVEGDEKVLAFCQVAPGTVPDETALRDWLAERLAGYKRPWRIIFADALPAAPTGKILKHRLKEVFAGQL